VDGSGEHELMVVDGQQASHAQNCHNNLDYATYDPAMRMRK
jgi:hypothetical protein